MQWIYVSTSEGTAKFRPPTSLFTAPKAPTPTGRLNQQCFFIYRDCSLVAGFWLLLLVSFQLNSSMTSHKYGESILKEQEEPCSFQGWPCCSSDCFSIPSAHTAQEKENRSLGLALRQENPRRPLACWGMVPYTVFLSQLKPALNSLDESIKLRLP